MTPAQIAGLTHRFRATLDNISIRTSNAVESAWLQLDDYDDKRIREFARRVQPVTSGSKAAAVALAAAFYATLSTSRPIGVSPKQIPLDYDARAPFVAYWNALSNQRPWPEAVQAGANRAASTADGLIVSSSRLTGDHVLPRARWTRAAAGNACDFCREAANGTYTSAEAADFGHERCSCTAIPI